MVFCLPRRWCRRSGAPRGRCRSFCRRTMDADAVLVALRERYAGRGVELVEAGGGVQFRTAPDLAPRLRKVIEMPAPAAARGDGDAGDHRLPPAGDAAGDRGDPRHQRCRSRRWMRCWRPKLIAPKGRTRKSRAADAVGHHAAFPGAVRAEGPARIAAAGGSAAGAAAGERPGASVSRRRRRQRQPSSEATGH